MTADRRSSQLMSCWQMRLTCNPPHQVILSHAAFWSMQSVKHDNRGVLSDCVCVCVLQRCVGTTAWLSLVPGLASLYCFSRPVRSSSPAPTSSLCCIPTLYGQHSSFSSQPNHCPFSQTSMSYGTHSDCDLGITFFQE